MFSVNKPKCNPAAVAELSVSLCNAPKFRYFGRPGLLFRAPQLGSYTGTELQLGIPEFPNPARDPAGIAGTGSCMGTKTSVAALVATAPMVPLQGDSTDGVNCDVQPPFSRNI